jgi:hypothetical protein
MCLCIRFHCRKLVSVFFDYLFNGKKMFFVFRIEGNVIKADTTYMFYQLNYLGKKRRRFFGGAKTHSIYCT